MTISRAVCPVCGQSVADRAHNRAFPFCGPPCKLVDLERWLDGRYRVASDEVGALDEGDGDASQGVPRSYDA